MKSWVFICLIAELDRGIAMNIKPADFIENLRKTDPYIKTIFMNGGCYKFAVFLKTIWSDSQFVINTDKDHVGLLIEGVVYDINGVADWSFTHMTKDDLEMAEKWSFAKKMMLQIGECSFCEEPIAV